MKGLKMIGIIKTLIICGTVIIVSIIATRAEQREQK